MNSGLHSTQSGRTKLPRTGSFPSAPFGRSPFSLDWLAHVNGDPEPGLFLPIHAVTQLAVKLHVRGKKLVGEKPNDWMTLRRRHLLGMSQQLSAQAPVLKCRRYCDILDEKMVITRNHFDKSRQLAIHMQEINGKGSRPITGTHLE